MFVGLFGPLLEMVKGLFGPLPKMVKGLFRPLLEIVKGLSRPLLEMVKGMCLEPAMLCWPSLASSKRRWMMLPDVGDYV